MTPAQWKKASLVKRLRSRKGTWVSTEHSIVHPEHTMREAAGEIEALRTRAEAAEAERDRLRDRLSDTPALVLDALAEIATQATLAMSDEAVRSVTLAQGDDPDLVAERVRAIIYAALNGGTEE